MQHQLLPMLMYLNVIGKVMIHTYFGANQTQQGCFDIAHQLVLHSPPIDLVFGGGRRFIFIRILYVI